jgi:hypothetical protein
MPFITERHFLCLRVSIECAIGSLVDAGEGK